MYVTYPVSSTRRRALSVAANTDEPTLSLFLELFRIDVFIPCRSKSMLLFRLIFQIVLFPNIDKHVKDVRSVYKFFKLCPKKKKNSFQMILLKNKKYKAHAFQNYCYKIVTKILFLNFLLQFTKTFKLKRILISWSCSPTSTSFYPYTKSIYKS